MENKDKKIFNYSELLVQNEDEVKMELKQVLGNQNCEMVIDFEKKYFTDEELKKFFLFILENKKSKIIMLRNIVSENYQKLKYFQNLEFMKNLK